MKFPVLNLPNCIVRPFEARDLTERYVGWLNDPVVVRYSEQRHRCHTLESCRGYFESFDSSADIFLAIECHELGHVGNLTISSDIANETADVSIMVGERGAWGRGYGLRAWSAVLDHLLGPAGVRKVTAGTMSVNQPMLRVMERSGMKIEAVKEKQFLFEGSEVDLVMAAKFAQAQKR